MGDGRTRVHDDDAVVTRPVPADWLALRRDADHRARDTAGDLVELLAAHLRRSGVEDDPAGVRIIDVGAGTGSNQAWLADRLPLRQSWTLVDHDASLVGAADESALDHVVSTTRQVAGIDGLAPLVPRDAPVVVTCAALLDLLAPPDIEALAAVIAPTDGPGAAALLSLSVTGQVEIAPADPDDAAIADAFDAHQRREDILGPDAAEAMAEVLRRRGAHVRARATDWVLGAGDEALLRRYLSDRAAVAVEHDERLRLRAGAWLQRRERQLDAGMLRVTVGHTDLLSLPAPEAVIPGGPGAALDHETAVDHVVDRSAPGPGRP